MKNHTKKSVPVCVTHQSSHLWKHETYRKPHKTFTKVISNSHIVQRSKVQIIWSALKCASSQLLNEILLCFYVQCTWKMGICRNACVGKSKFRKFSETLHFPGVVSGTQNSTQISERRRTCLKGERKSCWGRLVLSGSGGKSAEADEYGVEHF